MASRATTYFRRVSRLSPLARSSIEPELSIRIAMDAPSPSSPSGTYLSDDGADASLAPTELESPASLPLCEPHPNEPSADNPAAIASRATMNSSRPVTLGVTLNTETRTGARPLGRLPDATGT